MARVGLCPTQGHTTVPCRAGPHSEASQVPARGHRVVRTVPGTQEGLKWAVPSPFPSVPLASRLWIQLSRGSQGSRHPEAQKSNGGEEGIGPEWDFYPPFPCPHPPSAKAWGCQL